MKPIYICTGPSSFTPEVVHMVEDFFDGNPVLLYGNDEENLKYWASQASALILAGGNDIHFSIYGQSYPSNCNMKKFDLKRDRREIKLIDLCIENKVPILGLCRGFQLLAIHRKKMRFICDISNGDVVHQPALQEPNYDPDPTMPIHTVKILDGRPLFGEMPPEGKKFRRLWTNSFHHQAVDFYNKNDPHIIGVADFKNNDEIVELMENVEEGWIGSQWHPELDYECQESSRKLLAYFKKFYVEERGFVDVKKKEE